ncbi:amidase domain-containing protein [Streptomyces sp. NPDC085900]|uniref:amidase domain-containing protein n=1 Tax=Streptomyces sp. NPDC085900 TaxID=3365737 RepID=UPI0037CF22A1
MRPHELGARARRTTVTATALATVLLPVTAAHAAQTPAPAVTAATTDAFGRLADAVLTDRTDALVQGTRPASRTALTSAETTTGLRLAAAQAKSETSALTALHGTRSRLAALGEAYTHADTRVRVDSVRRHGRTATVRATETTTLTYAKIRGDEPATTGFTAHHRFTFTAAPDGTWQLTRERLTDKGPRPVNAPAPAAATATARPGAVIDAPSSATTYPAPAAPKNLGTSAPYNYPAMAAYAEKYWKNYNTAYRRYNGMGGDCTNFLSQSLYAGGWKQVTASTEDYDTWYSGSSSDSDTWIGVNEWSWFTQTAKRTTPLANAYQMDVGDVLQMDFDKDGSKDHSMMTTYRSGSGVPYVTYHDADTYRRSLSSLIASYPNSGYYAYRS